MQTTSPTWKWMLADGGKGLPAAEYTGAAVSFDNPGHTYPKALSVAIGPVQSGSGTPSPDNVRPISGWDGVRVTRCGKNVCTADWHASGSGISYDDGVFQFLPTTGTQVLSFDFADDKFVGKDVTVSFDLWGDGDAGFRFDGQPDGVYVGGTAFADKALYVTQEKQRIKYSGKILEGTTSFRVFRTSRLDGASQRTVYVANFQIELGSVATEYEPYLGETYSIAFPAGVGTVYGGTLDVTTGLLTVDRGMVDLGTLNWTVEAAGGTHPNWNIFYAAVPNAKGNFSAYGTTQICSHYANQTEPTWNDDSCRFGLSSTNINISDSALSGYTAAQFKAAMSGVQLVYELTEPVTYQLDPVAVALLRGMNHIQADAGDVTVVLGALGDVQLEAVAEIGGTTYDDLPVAPVVNRALMQGGLSVGNAVSASCALSIRTGNSIPRAAEVLLKVRLTDGVTTSEWLPAGTFYISRRSVDPVTGILSLECYDALLKANALWEPEEGDLPMAMADAAEALAGLLGVALDGRNDIATGAAYVIDSLAEGETIRDTLARIAVANGGNWIITPANRLRLVPLADAADAAAATADALDVEGVTGGISVQPASVVTGIRYGGEDGDAILGDDTGTVIDIGENAAFLQVLYDRLVGLTFRPFDLAGAVYDPAAELGDYVRAGANGEVASVLHSEVASYGPGFTGTLSAPQGGELADEYPYIGGAANKALLAARAYARQISEALDHSLTQQEVFDRLTGNGAAQGLFLTQDGQLFINASYIYSGLLTLGGLNNENGTMRVLDASGNVICTLSNTGVDITDGSVATYSADRLLRSILSNGQLSVQYWGQDGGTGRYLWKNMLAITADTDGGEVRASTGALTLRGKDEVHLSNRSGTTDTVYATADMEDDDIRLHVWSAPNGAYDGDSTFEMGPDSVKMSVGDGDPTTDDPTVELSRNGLDASAPRVNVTATDGAASVSATYTDLSGNEHTGTLAYDGDTLDVEGALDVSDPARTRANLGITPANIGALPATGGTVTGAVARKIDKDFDTPPSSQEYTQVLPITDEDNAIRGGVYMVRNTDGSYQAIYGAYKPGVGWNYIAPKINADDSFGYDVNHPEALLSAIGVRWKKVTGTTSAGGTVGLDLAKNRYMVVSVWSSVGSGSSHICTPMVAANGTNWLALVETVTHAAVANTAVTLYVGYIDFGAGNIS